MRQTTQGQSPTVNTFPSNRNRIVDTNQVHANEVLFQNVTMFILFRAFSDDEWRFFSREVWLGKCEKKTEGQGPKKKGLSF